MAKVLLNTDILSEILKGKNAAVAAKASAYLAEHGRFTTSAVTVAEIVYGLRRVGRGDRVALFEASLADAEVLPFDDDAARLAGRINADLERVGRIIGLPDVMIAAVAIRSGLAVITGNTAHFEHVRVARYDLLIDNWRLD
jgi:tRNA(fMet)-specific endonuclease VapC